MALALGQLDPPRLIVTMPPGHGKTMLASKYFPAWYLGTFPDRKVIVTSATDTLAVECSIFARDFLREFGPSEFEVNVRRDISANDNWQLAQGGGMRAAGVRANIMGQRANLLIIDDFFKDVKDSLSETTRKDIDEWFLSTSRTRLFADGAVLIVATRWNIDDLIGRRIKAMANGGEHWHVIDFPALAETSDVLGRQPGDALWEAAWPRKALERLRADFIASGYGWMWEALYQGHPPSILDAEFNPLFFGESIWFDNWPAAKDVADRVMFLDPSLGKNEKADYSAIVMIVRDTRGGMWVDCDMERRGLDRIAEASVVLAKSFAPYEFALESNGFQVLLKDPINRRSKEHGYSMPVVGVENMLPKPTRIRGLTEYLARGEIHFKRNSPGCRLLVEQLKGFPTMKNDDGPDALAGGVERLRDRYYGGMAGKFSYPQVQSDLQPLGAMR
jgi:predicted phage terminase large subunit-like protein